MYLRIRPTKKPSHYYEVQQATDKNYTMKWDIPQDAITGSEFVNNTKTKFAFKFNQILPMDISQAQASLPRETSGCLEAKGRSERQSTVHRSLSASARRWC